MSELVPSVILYGQALKLLEMMREAQEAEVTHDTDGLVVELASILTRFEEEAGSPLLNYIPVSETEPPSSAKSNLFWSTAEKDVNLLQQQVDMLRAAAVFSHNTTSTEIANAHKRNAQVKNKLKTLQLYSNGQDDSIISFGDSFSSLDQMDINAVPAHEQPTLAHEGYLTLGRRGALKNLSRDAVLKVLDGSNGFLGNNQEIENPSTAVVDPSTGIVRYEFLAETNSRSNLRTILDGEPNTWIEYEIYEVRSSDRRAAKNLGFSYLRDSGNNESQRVDWANGPGGGTLKLGLEFDLESMQNVNSIELLPFGLEENKNYPVLVRRIQTSPNGTDWTSVFPTNVWVGPEVNIQAARTAPNVIAHKAVWSFSMRAVRFIRAYIEQPNPITVNVGHVYWSNTRTGEKRVEGPLPIVGQIPRFYQREAIGDVAQRREFFQGKRWAIGIRDFEIQQAEYMEKSVMVTRRLQVGGVIDRVMLDRVDLEVPTEYPSNETWVKFYISPNDGEDWYQISSIDDTEMGAPNQVSFNDPIHGSLREFSVVNHTTETPVTHIRLKIEISRPSGMSSTTPVLKSYSLKVKRR